MENRKHYYGVIGNGETCAFVSPAGSIEWLCLPRFDGKIVYAKALDPNNGKSLGIELLGKKRSFLLKEAGQSYYSKTNVLRTRLLCKNFEVVVKDFMPWRQSLIYRLIRIKNITEKTKKAELRINSDVGKRYMDIRDGSVIHRCKDFVLMAGIKDWHEKSRIKPGDERKITLILAYGETRKAVEKQLAKAKLRDPQLEMERCKQFWTNWVDKGRQISFRDEHYKNMYYRSLLALKLLIYRKTGAVVAAPTTSFPAYPGYEENWDYRFAWVRDSYFVMRSLLKSGHHIEVKYMLDFLFSVQDGSGHWKYPLYQIDGKMPKKESIVEELTGPNQEEEIRLSNEARDQLQLDSEGSVLHGLYLYYIHTGDIGFIKKHWNHVKKAAQWITRNYYRQENGIWEFRERKADWTYGKVICYVGLESGIAIASLFDKKFKSWEKTKNKIKADILKKAWSEQRQSFLQTYESDGPADISVLSIGDYGLLRPNDRKIRSTVRLMEQKLVMENGGVKRFENALLPFYLPTLWLAQHYIRAGNMKRAKELIATSIKGSTNLYLVAEHFDPQYGAQHGNFPQAFNASSFVETIIMFKEFKDKIWNFMDIKQWRDNILLPEKLIFSAGKKAAKEGKAMILESGKIIYSGPKGTYGAFMKVLKKGKKV